MPGINLLLVEDNPADVKLMRLWFRQSAAIAEVHAVSHGADALRLLRRQAEFQHHARPHLVVVDSNLPDMLGIELLSEIRQDRDLSQTDVLMLSGSFDAADSQLARELGAMDYRAKPADLDGFSALVKFVEQWAANLQARNDNPS
jgi:CheY-like chemotaxis protein